MISAGRNGLMSLASVSTVAISLFILALFLVAAVNLQNIATVLQSQVEVVAYVEGGFDRQWTSELMGKINALPMVAEAHFVTKDEALDRLREQFGEKAYLLEAVEKTNPLRDSVEVRVTDPARIKDLVAGLEGIQSVSEVSYKGDVIDKLTRMTEALKMAGVTLVVLLALATVFIIANTVRLTVFSRRREIAVMRLVGATNSFIRLPFFFEGLILGVVGALVASVAIWLGYDWLLARITQNLPFVPFLGSQPLLGNLSKLLLAAGAGIGALGSVVSLQRHLQV